MKLIYIYENGEKVVHTTFVNSKTMKKEGKDSKYVDVLKFTNNEYYLKADEILFDDIYNVSQKNYVSRISLK